MCIDDGARVATVLFDGPFGAAAVALNASPPVSGVAATLRGQTLVTLQPAEAAVVRREGHRPALAVIGGLDVLIEPMVVFDQGADGPLRVRTCS